MTPRRDAGPIAEEAALLLDALRGWAGAFADHDDHAPGSATVCRVCPVCRLLALLRDARPETFEHLVDAAGSLTLALRSVLEAQQGAGQHRAGGEPGDEGGGRRVQRIDIG